MLIPSVKNNSPLDLKGGVNLKKSSKSFIWLMFFIVVGWSWVGEMVYCSEKSQADGGNGSYFDDRELQELQNQLNQIIQSLKGKKGIKEDDLEKIKKDIQHISYLNPKQQNKFIESTIGLMKKIADSLTLEDLNIEDLNKNLNSLKRFLTYAKTSFLIHFCYKYKTDKEQFMEALVQSMKKINELQGESFVKLLEKVSRSIKLFFLAYSYPKEELKITWIDKFIEYIQFIITPEDIEKDIGEFIIFDIIFDIVEKMFKIGEYNVGNLAFFLQCFFDCLDAIQADQKQNFIQSVVLLLQKIEISKDLNKNLLSLRIFLYYSNRSLIKSLIYLKNNVGNQTAKTDKEKFIGALLKSTQDISQITDDSFFAKTLEEVSDAIQFFYYTYYPTVTIDIVYKTEKLLDRFIEYLKLICKPDYQIEKDKKGLIIFTETISIFKEIKKIVDRNKDKKYDYDHLTLFFQFYFDFLDEMNKDQKKDFIESVIRLINRICKDDYKENLENKINNFKWLLSNFIAVLERLQKEIINPDQKKEFIASVCSLMDYIGKIEYGQGLFLNKLKEAGVDMENVKKKNRAIEDFFKKIDIIKQEERERERELYKRGVLRMNYGSIYEGLPRGPQGIGASSGTVGVSSGSGFPKPVSGSGDARSTGGSPTGTRGLPGGIGTGLGTPGSGNGTFGSGLTTVLPGGAVSTTGSPIGSGSPTTLDPSTSPTSPPSTTPSSSNPDKLSGFKTDSNSSDNQTSSFSIVPYIVIPVGISMAIIFLLYKKSPAFKKKMDEILKLLYKKNPALKKKMDAILKRFSNSPKEKSIIQSCGQWIKWVVTSVQIVFNQSKNTTSNTKRIQSIRNTQQPKIQKKPMVSSQKKQNERPVLIW